jgi:hypothetical protein
VAGRGLFRPVTGFHGSPALVYEYGWIHLAKTSMRPSDVNGDQKRQGDRLDGFVCLFGDSTGHVPSIPTMPRSSFALIGATYQV